MIARLRALFASLLESSDAWAERMLREQEQPDSPRGRAATWPDRPLPGSGGPREA